MSNGTNKVLSSTAAWIFGLATSVLFVSLWGRAVVIDTAELSDSLLPLSQSEQVVGAFSEWMTNELVETGVAGPAAKEATDTAVATTQVSAALENLVGEVVEAAASDQPEGAAVDVARTLRPTVPAVSAALMETGVPVSEPQVELLVSRLDPLVVRQPGEPPVVGRTSPLARRLGTAAILAVIAQLIFGSSYVLAAPDRLKRLRTLLTRFAVTGLSFAVLLKLGSWVLDPQGGRAPISATLSNLADSKWLIPALLGAIGAIAAMFVWLVRASRPTPAAASPGQVAATTPR